MGSIKRIIAADPELYQTAFAGFFLLFMLGVSAELVVVYKASY